MWEISRKTSYLLGNIYLGIGEIMGTGHCVNDKQTKQTVESQLMMSQRSCTQNDCTNQLQKLITQDKMTSRPRMEMSNNAFGCSRGTQVHVEDLRLVNLTEFHPNQRG